MRITKNKLKLNVPTQKYMPTIQDEIRQNLTRMGVSGLTIDMRYDIKTNQALLKFIFNDKSYEMRVGNQKDVRANMYALSRRIEYKVRMHLLDIESFDISISPYLAIEDKSGFGNASESIKASGKFYAVLGIPEYTNDEDIKKRYLHLVKTYHPDMALSEEAKTEFTKRLAEINEAYGEIKKERTI